MDFNTPAARLDKLAAHYQRRIAGSGELRIPYPAHIVTGKIRRIKCPVHGGKNLSAAVGFNDGRAWAKCWSRDCASADILAALNLTPSPSIRLRLPRPTPTPTITPPLPPVSPAQGREYLEGIRTGRGAWLLYQRQDGQRGKHWRNLEKRRNPGVTGDGWQVRRFNPQDPSVAVAITLTEGEKDAALLAQAGLISFCAPRGWGGLKTADFTELVATAKATELPVMLCGDNDTVGRLAMRRVRERLRDEGLNPIDTGGRAPAKGSIADLPADEIDALIRLQVMELDPHWQKPVRNRKQYQGFKCLRPKRWQGVAGDGQTITNLRPCGNTSACERCKAWEAFLHIERAWRGRPAQMVSVSGFGDDASSIAETVGQAKAWRELWEDRLRKSSAIRQKEENPSSKWRNFLTALRVRDDYRAGVAMFLSEPLTAAELSREQARAERAGLTVQVVDKPTRADIEAVAPKSLTVAMEGYGDTSATRTWTSSGWPPWLELDKTYQFSDGRELEEGEDFDPDAIEARAWQRDYHQSWDTRATLRSNVMRREEHAAHNAALWVGRCQGLNIEILWGIANATSSSEINALVQEVGDYDGPVSLLRDTAQYLAGLRPWRKAFRPVLDVAGWRG